MKRYTLFIYVIGVALLMGSCKVTKEYEQPEAETDGLYRTDDQKIENKDTSTSAPELPWNTFFPDDLLQQHIEEALSNNYDLKIAIQRMSSASAMLEQSKKAFLPSLQGYASVSRSRLAYPQGFGFVKDVTQYDLGISTSWEADIWGKLSSAKRARLAGLLQTEASQKAIKSALIANVAINYYQLIALDEQLEILKETASNRKDYVTTMKKLKNSNVVDGSAVVQSEANQYVAELAIPDIERQIRETENALSVLLGRKPGPVERKAFEELRKDTEIAFALGVPADLMANRPNVIQAELAYRSAFELTNVARTQFYPSLSITGGAGFSSFEWDDLFTENIGLFGNIAAGLVQPIFNKGINKANLKTAEAQQQIALYDFQHTLLEAGKEVSDALFAYQTASSKTETRELQLEALHKSVEYTKKLLQYNSQTNYTDVLTSEQNLLAAEVGNINDILERKIALVNLYKALGGGWSEE